MKPTATVPPSTAAVAPRAGAVVRAPMDGLAMLPFGTAALLGLALALWTSASNMTALWAAAMLTIAVIALALVLSRRARAGWADVLPSLAYVGVVALLRHASDGGESGLSALLLLPVVAMALHGSLAQVGAVVVAASLAIATPIVLVGAPLYPDAEWRQFLVLTAVATLIGVAISQLVSRAGRLTAAADRARREADEHAGRVVAIVDASSDPIITLDADLRIRTWNPAAAQLLGLPADEAIGADALALLLAPDDAVRIREGYDAIRRSRRAARRRFELDVRTADRRTVPVEVSVLVDPEASCLAVHVVARDIGARRAADALAKEHLADLNELVRVAGMLGHLDDAGAVRRLMCEAAIALSGADHAVLFEPAADDATLVPTADAGTLRIPHTELRRNASRAGSVMADGRPFFVSDLESDPAADHLAAARMRVRSAYWLPIRQDGASIAVLVQYWSIAHEQLPDRVTQLLALLADQARTAIGRAEELGRMAEEARTDPLTGAANRRGLRVALERAASSGRAFSLILLDHDHFKAYNDTHGHLAGDDLLRSTAAAWGRVLRPEDTLARYGGEEFLAVLPDCTLADAARTADRLRGAVGAGRTVSAGVATWDGREPIATITSRADAALYRAKARGRNRTEVDPGAPVHT